MNTISIIDLKIETIKKYQELTKEENKIKKEREELKRKIFQWVAENNTEIIGAFNVFHEVRTSEGLDREALYKDFPDIKKEYPKITKSHFLKIF